MRLAGIDLAWQGDKNTSAIALGELSADKLKIDSVYPAIRGLGKLISIIGGEREPIGVAIDAPLIIRNRSGARECEKHLAKDYASRRAGCHPANLSLYPDPSSVRLSEILANRGYIHLQPPDQGKWQIECYPHPAIIEIFGLEKRLLYKKGSVAQRQQGQVQLARYIKALSDSSVIALVSEPSCTEILDERRICTLRGKRLKQNEDALDSIICLYICALYSRPIDTGVCYGSAKIGYIFVPQVKCI